MSGKRGMSSAMAHPHHHQHQHQHHQHRQKKVLRAYILVRACRTDHKFVQRYHAEHISFATWRGEHRSTIELCIAPTSEVCVWYGLPSQSVFCSTFILTKKIISLITVWISLVAVCHASLAGAHAQRVLGRKPLRRLIIRRRRGPVKDTPSGRVWRPRQSD